MMKFKSDRQRRAVFSRLSNLGNYSQPIDCNRFSRLSSLGNRLQLSECDRFSRLSGKGVVRFSDIFGNESLPTVSQLIAGHRGIWEGVIPRNGFSAYDDVPDVTTEDFVEYSRKNDEKNFSSGVGEEVVGIGNDNITYGVFPGKVKEVKGSRVLVHFDSGEEVWYPEDLVLTQNKIDAAVKNRRLN